jgi:uncharacterized protein (TIGR02246 family)
LSRTRIVLAGGIAAAALWLAFGNGGAETAGQTPAGGGAAPVPAAGQADRSADEAAVKKAVEGLVADFGKGDAKAVAGRWTAEGEYINHDGATFHGRAALEKGYTETFGKNPGNKLEVEIDSVRFPSRDNAVVEGHFKLRKGKGADLVVSRCSLLYAREDGNWHIAIAREWPGDGLSLRDLEFLIGTWESKKDGVSVSTKYEWTTNKSFIRCHFTITQDGKSVGGTQIIGKDPATGALRVWTFEDAGGIGDTDITRDGKKWVFTARGATADGKVLTATNFLTPIDADTFTWHSVERELDDEELPDLPPVKVVRVKTK